jgi:oxygen-independent coproporphyrinogen-3 oxidase
MSADLISRYGVPVPRYTSYPTANHFSAAIGSGTHRGWLQSLAPGSQLSLYVHIPYCRELCHYCGCNTKATQRYRPVANYLTSLEQEIDIVGGLVPSPHAVTHMHWGGGSPNVLDAPDITRLGIALRECFDISRNAEFAVEIDARELRDGQAEAFAKVGVNRVSLGVQDFNETVQRAIGRMQSYEATRQAVERFRKVGIDSINIDLVYGLPHQTEDSVARTIEQVLTLDPDRVTIFGYAHLPSKLKHQRLIDEAALPGLLQRFQQSQRVAEMLVTAGYRQIGLDHFARTSDSLSQKPLARNFQGYTTDAADALIGLGASAISRLPQGFAQNEVAVDSYARRLMRDGLATARGWSLTRDDRVRAHVIERLMCDFTFSADELTHRYGDEALEIVQEAQAIATADADGLIRKTDDGFELTARGRPFVRSVCAQFDAYLPRAVEQRRHALGV